MKPLRLLPVAHSSSFKESSRANSFRNSGFNRLDLEANIPDAVLSELKARGHDVKKVRPLSINGCATAVLIDPASGNRIAGADPRRDCYAIAY